MVETIRQDRNTFYIIDEARKVTAVFTATHDGKHFIRENGITTSYPQQDWKDMIQVHIDEINGSIHCCANFPREW
jgi:hypothetical protein